MDFQSDHCNIPSLRHLFANYSRKAIETMKTLTIAEQDIPRFPSYYTLTVFRNVEELDLHGCKLEALPSDTLVRAFKKLKKLNLSRNLLTTVKDVLPFGTLSNLADLNLTENPIPYVDHRIKLMQSLLFPLTLVRFKIAKFITGEYRQTSSAFSTPLKQRTKSHTGIRQFLLLRRKPAPTPRPGHFPMLSVLNEQVITEDEVVSAKPYSDEDVVPVRPTHARTATGTPLVFRGDRKKTAHTCCVVRKSRVESVPRFMKIQEYVGEGVLESNFQKPKAEPVDPKDRHRLHRANHQERDTGEPIKHRRSKRIRPKPFRVLPTIEASDVAPPSYANEEDTLRRSSSSEVQSSSEGEEYSPAVAKARTEFQTSNKAATFGIRTLTSVFSSLPPH